MTVPPRGSTARSRPTLSRRARILMWIAFALVVLSQVVPRLLGLYVDWAWFGSVDAESVIRTEVLTRIGLFAAVGLLVGGAVAAALFVAHRHRPVYLPPAGAPDVLARYRAALTTGRRSPMVWGPLVLGVLAGLVAQTQWRTLLAFVHRTPFGRVDPEFGKDIAFYAFDLPFWRLAVNWLLAAVVLAFLASLVANYVLGGIRPGARQGALSRPARIQLVVLAGVFVLLKAWAYWLDRYELLFRAGETFTGAGYTDVNAVMPAKVFMFAVALVCAVAFFSAVVVRDLRIPALATVLLVFSAVVVGSLWPLAVEQFSVKPNRADKEREYIARNIDATRAAYGIGEDNVSYVRDWGAVTPDPAEASSDQATLSSIRVLDPNVLAPTFTQQKQLKNFYGFPSTLSVDRYRVDGRLQDYVVAARELDPSTLRDNQRDWINRHTVYTHGNGFIAAPANRVDEIAADAGSDRGGLPNFQVSDLDALAAKAPSEIPVTEPRIYFGEVIGRANPDYAIVGDTGDGAREYDTDSSKYTYTGTGGVPVGDWFSRIAFAAEFSERNILLSGAIGADSRILFDRDPRDRVQKVAPWLTTDTSTYPVVVDGRIKWVVDGYTTLDSFPYAELTSLSSSTGDSLSGTAGARSQPDKKVSYIRNSVKAVVDAYDGSVSLYAMDEKDPVLQTWRKAFPGVVQDRSAMSPELVEHVRYPEDLFKVQRTLLARYHVEDPGQFFTNDAFWSVPTDPSSRPGPVQTATPAATGTGGSGSAGGSAGPGATPPPDGPSQPAYYVMAADPRSRPGADRPATFQLTSAFRGYNREFLAAHMSAAADPENYGQITVRVQRPVPNPPPGPNLAEGQMLSNPKVSPDRALWERTATIVDGNLLALPLANDSILYVEPVYTQRKGQDAAYPRLTRVMVYYNGQVGYASTVHDALSQVGIETDPTRTKTAEKGMPAASAPAEPKPGGSAAAGPTSTPTPAPAGGRDAAVTELDKALKEVRDAQTSGDLGRLGKGLDTLQKAVDRYQATTGNGGN